MFKLLLVLYAIPYIFCGMYCQWIDFGLFMTILTLLTFIPPFAYAYLCGKRGYKTVFIWGNILTFITSLIPTIVLNSFNLTNEIGMSWYGTFKPLNSIEMVVFCFVISLIVQNVIYVICKKINK